LNVRAPARARAITPTAKRALEAIVGTIESSVQSLNPPTDSGGRVTATSSAMPNHEYIGAEAIAAPGVVTFEDPAMATARIAGGLAPDRQIEQSRADANRQGWKTRATAAASAAGRGRPGTRFIAPVTAPITSVTW